MSRQGYTLLPTVATPGQSSNHGISSACSASINPDEDWSQVLDLAERRRIQNRISQRNYRKKLKRRLEDLERRAGSSSGSPPQVHSQLKPAAKKTPIDGPSYKPTANNNNRQKLSTRVIPHNQFTPLMHNDNDIFSTSFDREDSYLPSLFPYHHTYPAPEMLESIYQPYTSSQACYLASMMPTVDAYEYENLF